MRLAAIAGKKVPFSLILPTGRLMWIRLVGSFLCALLVGRYVWGHSSSVRRGLLSSVILGAFTTGAVGFSAGFFGPIIFAPDANQGPLLGIFITGPLGGGLGSATHSLLDALMYGDVHPFWPVTSANPFLGILTAEAVQLACVAAGIVGMV